MTESSNPKVGVLARPGQVDVRISARADSAAAARALIAAHRGARARRPGRPHLRCRRGDPGERGGGGPGTRRGWRVASYEDRTGGSVAAALREAAGEHFVEGRVVATETGRARLAQAGGEGSDASGAALAAAMARAVLRLNEADLAVAVHSADAAVMPRTLTRRAQEPRWPVRPRWRAPPSRRTSPRQHLAGGSRASAEHRHHLGIGARGQVDRRRVAVAALSLLRRALL